MIGTSAAADTADRAQQQRARADPSAEHDQLRVEDRADRRDRRAQPRGDVIDDRARRGVPAPASSNTSWTETAQGRPDRGAR